MRIGILGGTFDPIHIAHLIVAEEARVQLNLKEVVFIPVGQPWLKADQPVSPANLRMEMVRVAIASNPFFRVSSIEVDRPGPTYTLDTLVALREELGREAELHFILGTDALQDLPRWKEPNRILELCTPVVFTRPEYENVSPTRMEEALPGIAKKVRVLRDPQIGVSGTEIRRRVADGTSIRYLVPEGVERFIMEHRLYCKEEADG
ncbi:MAG: nicotinate-nucleotide adenylyltransferase [Chloroflexi bacterium]|nr:nicotinate-nucleotide adenylyltransferase [Chloroflexota bacterium]MCZ6789554.1 nicotinate-nucleotide adenylyltransferase [Chloroflexota bacterium]MCZ6891243.1 nicotinate-nucleotide adenylyltransferase [Chloroflexota bacterium]